MIQFNLLPSVKKEYIKARRTKRLITSISTVAIIASIAVVGVLFSVVQFGQKSHINDLTDDIQQKVAELNQIDDLDKILTIQNQLDSLEKLHQGKPESSRLFNYFTQLTPSDATIANLTVDFVEGTITITGTAKDIATVNKFADTLKFTKYTSQPVAEATAEAAADDNQTDSASTLEEVAMFSSVLTQVTRSEQDTTYILETLFDTTVFDNTLDITLRVPDIVTTRSVLNKPNISQNGLFDDIEEDTLLNPGFGN